MESALRASTAQQIQALPLFARFGLGTGGFNTIHFDGQAVHYQDNVALGEQVDAHKEWQRADVLRRLFEMGARCASNEALMTNFPLAPLRTTFGQLRIDTVEFPEPAERGGYGGRSRAAPYVWELTLHPEDRPEQVYVVGVEPFACAVTYILRRLPTR